jgi:hypothetical protein
MAKKLMLGYGDYRANWECDGRTLSGAMYAGQLGQPSDLKLDRGELKVVRNTSANTDEAVPGGERGSPRPPVVDPDIEQGDLVVGPQRSTQLFDSDGAAAEEDVGTCLRGRAVS